MTKKKSMRFGQMYNILGLVLNHILGGKRRILLLIESPNGLKKAGLDNKKSRASEVMVYGTMGSIVSLLLRPNPPSNPNPSSIENTQKVKCISLCCL